MNSIRHLAALLTLAATSLAQIPYDPPTAVRPQPNVMLLMDATRTTTMPAQFPGTPYIFRNFTLNFPNTTKPLPQPGAPAILTFGVTFSGDVSADGGATFNRLTAPATATFSTTYAGPVAGGTTYSTEMLQIDISGGSLPAGVMLRESPTRASTGQTTITDIGGGNFQFNSTTNLFTELSMNGGAVWIPHAGAALAMNVLRLVPEVFNDVAVFPPRGRHVSAPGFGSTGYSAGNAVVSDLDMNMRADLGFITFSEAATLPDIPGTVDTQFDISLDGGATHQRIAVSGPLVMRMSTTPTVGYFDTEMLSMSLIGTVTGSGGATVDVMLRESPTRASLGKCAVRDVTGGAMVASFFDIFTDISLDGGGTWAVALKPLRVEIGRSIPENSVATAFFPPRNGRFSSDTTAPSFVFGNGTLLRNLRHVGFQQNAPLTGGGAGGPQVLTSSHTANFETSNDSGATWQARSATAILTMSCTTGDVSGTFDTEMLALNITGGNLPNGWMIRESPTRASTGLKLDTEVLDYSIGSFFDIFTELSTDGGATWHAADRQVNVQLNLVPSPEFQASNFLPLRSTLSADVLSEMRFVGSSTPIIRGSALGMSDPGTRTSPPATGASAIHSFFDVFVCELSLDGGQTWAPVSAPASVSTRTTGVTTTTFDTEMLQLDIAGGTLPPNIMLRESPTRASTGRTTIADCPGGFRIGSFFDIFTEISLDGGANWLPAVQKVNHTHRADAAPIVAASDFLPTPGTLRTLPGNPGAQTALGFVFQKIEMTNLSGPTSPPPPPSGTNGYSQSGIAEITWVPAPGQPAVTGRAPVSLVFTATNTVVAGLGGGTTQTFDTEMLSLNISGGDLPAGMILRESPTRHSRGPRQTSALDGSRWAVDSFFDIFTEVSLDGGATWQETDRALTCDLCPDITKISAISASLPRRHAASLRVDSWAAIFENIAQVETLDALFSAGAPLPPLGGSLDTPLTGSAEVAITLPGGGAVTGAGNIVAEVRVTSTGDSAGTRYFDTEMLSLNISGGTLPPGVMLRESPSKQSLGRTTSMPLPGGTHRIGSFFDIFTEISLDGGASWSRSDGPMRLGITPAAPPSLPVGRFFATTDYFPPPGAFEMGDILFPDGSTISNMRLVPMPGSPRFELPPPGLSTERTLSFELFFDRYEQGGAVTHVRVPMVEVRFRITGSPAGTDRMFDTEMLSLSLTGPSPILIRESPTLPSAGATRVTDGPDGGFMVSSFFDIFTEISLDGGASWQPATTPGSTALVPLVPMVGVPTDYFPPRNGVLGTLRNAPPLDFTNGLLVRNLRHDAFENNARLVDGAPPALVSCDHTATFEVSADNGLSWQPHTAPVTATVRVAAGDVSGDGIFDTEMLQLDIRGGTLPPGVMLRESPTRASTGRTTLVSQADGSSRIGSFFDIFTEISLDGGQNWTAATQPALVHHTLTTPAHFSPSNFLPLGGIMAMDDWEAPVAFVIQNIPLQNIPLIGSISLGFTTSAPRIPPPALGDTATHEVGGTATFQHSQDGGLSFTSVQGPYQLTYRVTNTGGTFDTEMLALNFTNDAGALPPGTVMLRESPTRASTGKTFIAHTNNGHRIGSFFDIFTELSVDGGATWSPATDTMHLTQQDSFDPVVELSGQFPPLGELESRPGGMAPRAQGQHIKTAKLETRKSSGLQPPPPGAPVVVESAHTFVWAYANDLGEITNRRNDALISIRYTLADSTADTATYDTEMLSLNLTGGGGGVMLRESPTRHSRGSTTVHSQTSSTRIGSFFDIFVELSTDGGATWALCDVPLHLDLTPTPATVGLSTGVVPGGSILSHALGRVGLDYAPAAGGGGGAGKVQMQDFHFTATTPATNLPPPSGSVIADLTGPGEIHIFLPDGTPVRATVNVQAQAHVISDFDLGGTRYFDTEMLQLSITGTGLPPGVMLRESPTLKSQGKTTARMLPGGSWAVDSFFDIFTEVSLDSGGSWLPSDGPLRLNPRSVPPAQPLDSAHFAATDFFPPPGVFEMGDIVFPDGSSLTGLRLTPAPNSPRLEFPASSFTFDTPLFFTYAGTYTNPGGSSTPLSGLPGTAVFRVTGSPSGTDRYFDTEMLSLSLNGLPPGLPNLRLRESPTLPSLGATRITDADGGFMVSSFFDIFTELSLDGGTTWTPAAALVHSELHRPPVEFVVPTNFFPPRTAVIGAPRNAPATLFAVFPHMHKRGVQHFGFEKNAQLIEAAGPGAEILLPHTVTFELSSDSGATFQTHTAPATARVRVAAGDVNGDGIFDTEMLQLDIAGGTLPPGVMLRESPTRASLGRTTLTQMPDGNFRIGSFFDIFTELSLDGGANWAPAIKPESVVLDNGTRRDFHSSNFLPLGGITAMDDWETPMAFVGFSPGLPTTSVGGVSLRTVPGGPRIPPPALGDTATHEVGGTATFEISQDGGLSFTSVQGPYQLTYRVTNTGGTFDTEMLALNFTNDAGALPPGGVMLRESPTRASTGRIQIDTTRGGFRIASFFDVFTELSLDGGANWSPATDTMHLEQHAAPEPVIVENNRIFSRGIVGSQAGLVAPKGLDVDTQRIALSPTTTAGIPLPAIGSVSTATLPFDFTWDTMSALGATSRHHGKAQLTIRVTPRDQLGNTRTFDTEMLSMSLTGGGGIMLRESPTRASLGRATVTDIGGGDFAVDSFFDIFTELSLDGGASWSPTDVPMQMMLLPAVQKVREASARLSQHARVAPAAGGLGLSYPNGAGAPTRIAFFDVFTELANNLPPVGGTTTGDFDGKGSLRFAAAGDPIHGVDVKLGATMSHFAESDGTHYFDTEMLQLEITGATLPPGVMFRESPTLKSSGSATSRLLPDGTWAVDSFFDIFTELSLDSGATWSPSDGPMRVEFTGQRRDLITGPGGNLPQVKIFDSSTAAPVGDLLAYPPTFTGGVFVASGDVNGDGVSDIITGAGPGGGPHVKVFSGVDERPIRSFLAYPPTFTGGVTVAAGDFDGDGLCDIITGAGPGAGPHVKVFSGATGSEIRSFFAYPPTFTGGVFVASGDVNGDGAADIITGTGQGTQPHVKVFDGRNGAEIRSFFAYGGGFTGGVYVAAGDVNGDGFADIITGAATSTSHVKVFDGNSGAELQSFLAYGATPIGVRVAAGDITGDGRAEIITGAGPGAGPHVKVFDGATGAEHLSFFAYSPTFTGGVFVTGPALPPRTPSTPTDADGDGLLDSWEHAHFGTTDTAYFDTDSDDDGINDGLELGLGLDPNIPNGGNNPPLTLEGAHLTLTITRQPGALYEVESGGSINAGDPDFFSPDTTTILQDFGPLLRVRDNFPIGTATKRFIRTKITGAP